jgi:hypothetical protein
MKFLRNTHNPDGSLRFPHDHVFEHWRTYQSEADTKHLGQMWVLHILDKDKPMSFDELVNETHKYNKDFIEPPAPIAEIALGLIRLLEDDMVKVV